jgi:hypothetical protein
VVQHDESLRIVPEPLWEQVRARRQEARRSWAGAASRASGGVESSTTSPRTCSRAR